MSLPGGFVGGRVECEIEVEIIHAIRVLCKLPRALCDLRPRKAEVTGP